MLKRLPADMNNNINESNDNKWVILTSGYTDIPISDTFQALAAAADLTVMHVYRLSAQKTTDFSSLITTNNYVCGQRHYYSDLVFFWIGHIF